MNASVEVRIRLFGAAVALAALGCALLPAPAVATDYFGQVEVLSNDTFAGDVSSGYTHQGALWSVAGGQASWHATFDFHQEGGMLDCSDGSSVYYTDDATGNGSGTDGIFALYLNGFDYSVSAASAGGEPFSVTRTNSCGEVTQEYRGPYAADTSLSGHYMDTRDSTNPKGLAGSISFTGNVTETVKIGWNLVPGKQPPSTVPGDLLRSGHLILHCSPRRCSLRQTSCFASVTCRYLAVEDPLDAGTIKGKRHSPVVLARDRGKIGAWHTRGATLATTSAGERAFRRLLRIGKTRIKGKLKITDNTSSATSTTRDVIKLKR